MLKSILPLPKDVHFGTVILYYSPADQHNFRQHPN